jgi:hypothetical protein
MLGQQLRARLRQVQRRRPAVTRGQGPALRGVRQLAAFPGCWPLVIGHLGLASVVAELVKQVWVASHPVCLK